MFDCLVYSELRVYLNQKMNMIGHYFSFNHFGLYFFCGRHKELSQPVRNFANKNFTPIFRTPNNVVFARIDYITT